MVSSECQVQYMQESGQERAMDDGRYIKFIRLPSKRTKQMSASVCAPQWGFCCTHSCVWGFGKARCFDLTVTDELWKVCKRHEVFLHWIYTKEPDVNLSKWRFSLLHLTTTTIFCCSECAAGFKIKNNRGKKGGSGWEWGGLKSLQTTTALPSKCQRVHSAACSFRVKLATGSYMLKFVMYVAPTESAFFCRCNRKGRMRNRQLVLTNGKKAFVPVYVGMCFQAISLKTVFPLSELFQEVKKCTCTRKHTSRKHTTGKANTDMTI